MRTDLNSIDTFNALKKLPLKTVISRVENLTGTLTPPWNHNQLVAILDGAGWNLVDFLQEYDKDLNEK